MKGMVIIYRKYFLKVDISQTYHVTCLMSNFGFGHKQDFE